MNSLNAGKSLPPLPSCQQESYCGVCGTRPERQPRDGFSSEEFAALLKCSGLSRESIDRIPVLTAVLILRREFCQFSGMRRPAQCDVDRPMFFYPWSAFPPDRRPILMHGAVWRAATGEAEIFPREPDGRFKAEHKTSHCPISPPGGYFIRPILVPSLPRWLMDRTCRLVRVVPPDEPLVSPKVVPNASAPQEF